MTTQKNLDVVVEAEQRDWTSLPEELLELILSNLHLINDIKTFHAVCKTWRLVGDAKDCLGFGSQWLIEKRHNRSTVKLFHPILCHPYCMDIPELRGASTHIIFSKDGWLLLFTPREWLGDIFFLNPFCKSKIELPTLPDSFCLPIKGATLTSNPTSDDCMVFVICALSDTLLQILTISRGEESWNVIDIDNSDFIFPSMFPSYCNPIFHDGKFYCLSRYGELGVFDPADNGWTVLEPGWRIRTEFSYESYLIDFDGDLMAVFLGEMGYGVFIFRWDESAMSWEFVNDLGENMLFLSVPTSFARKSVRDYMKNKMYFPRFHGKYGVFYSLEDGSYQTFGDDFSSLDLDDTTEQLECCWIEPTIKEHSNGIDWFGKSITYIAESENLSNSSSDSRSDGEEDLGNSPISLSEDDDDDDDSDCRFRGR